MELFNLLAPPAVTFAWFILWAVTTWNCSRIIRKYTDKQMNYITLNMKLKYTLHIIHGIMHELQRQIIHIEAIVERSPLDKAEIYKELCVLEKRINRMSEF